MDEGKSPKGAQQVTSDHKSQDIHIPTWLNKSGCQSSGPRATSAQQAHEAAGPAVIVLYHCGYFMAFSKCSLEPTTDLISLSVGCNTTQRRLYVPEDKLLKPEAILLEG